MSNTLRQVSGSIGISLITTIFTNRTTFHMNEMASSMNTADPFFMTSFNEFVQKIAITLHLPQSVAQQQAIKFLFGKANQQSAVSGINDAFIWATVISAIGLVLSLFLRDVRKDKVKAAAPAQKDEVLLLPSPKNVS
jgi:hypothetical protein